MANEIIKAGGKDIIAFLHGEHESVDVARPYEKETLLANTYIACFRTDLFERAQQAEEMREKLTLLCHRCDAEEADTLSIHLSDGTKLGYVPMFDRTVLFRLMEAGKILYANITAVEKRGDYPKVKVSIYLKD